MDIHNRTLRSLASCCLLLVTTAAVFAQQDPPATGSEADLLAVVQSDAPLFDKAKACQQLAVVGTRSSVPVLAKLLADETMGHYARFGLEPNPDPSVDEALRSALSSLKSGLLVGVVNSIGIRRDTGSVEDLKMLLGDSDPAVAVAAAAALGRIASAESVEILTAGLTKPAPLRLAVADACLTAGDMLVKEGKPAEAVKVFEAARQADIPRYLQLAALTESIRTQGVNGTTLLIEQLQSDDGKLFAVGLSLAHTIPGKDVTKALIAELEKPYVQPTADAQVLVIVQAKYGAPGKWVDVTERLMSAMGAGGITIEAGNHLAGDPAPATEKTLRVKYMLGNETKEAAIPEGESLKLAGAMPQNSRHAKIIALLQKRGDESALPAILKAVQDAPWDVRLPAVSALATLGDASAIPILLDTALADQGALSSAALSSLAELSDDAADQLIETRLSGSSGQAQRVLIELIGLREIASAVPTLFTLSSSDDPQLRQVALASLGLTVQLNDLPKLVNLLVNSTSPETAAEAKTALQKACQRMPDRDATSTILLKHVTDSPIETKADLFDLLGVIGGNKALAALTDAARSDDEQMVDVATQVLGKWMTADAAPVLLELAKSGNTKFRIRSLRGYIRIPRQLNVSPAEKLAMSAKALDVATRDQERALVIKDVLSTIPSVQALDEVLPHLDSPGLKADACEAAVAIAGKIVKSEPEAVGIAMTKVVAAAEDNKVRRRARVLRDRSQQ